MRSALIVSYDGSSWQAVDANGAQIGLSVSGEGWLPELPEGSFASRLLLPAEEFLCRTFTLPLSHPRFIDADILAQELNERTGENQENWWLAWQAVRDGDGVSGMIFGLPEMWRLEIQGHPQWKQVSSVGVDAWERIKTQLDSQAATANLDEGPIAVFDADAEGLFFGVWEKTADKAVEGIWRGMRRLNRAGSSAPDIAWQVRQSLLAMGWQEDAPAIGRLGSSLLLELGLQHWHGISSAEEALPGRQEAVLALPGHSNLEFRHGTWSARSDLGWLGPWRRSLTLAVAVMLVWTFGSAWQLHSLSAQAEQYRERINAAFHKGLPNETVMIDALAQLKRAAGSSADTGGSAEYLNQLQAIGKVYNQMPWEMQELTYRDGLMKISGRAGSLETLNRIRALMQQETGREVQLADTDLSGGQVAFRMHWQ